MFALKTILMVSTKKAQAAVNTLTKSVAHSAKVTDKANQRQQNSWQRLGSEMKTIAAVGAGLFAGLVAASPALQASLLMVSFEFREMARALGDELAPIINDYILPAVSFLTDAFLSMPQPIRLIIAVTIALTVAMGALAVIVGVLTVVSLPLIAVILAIVAVIWVIIWVFQNFDKVIGALVGSFNWLADSAIAATEWMASGVKWSFEQIYNIVVWVWDKLDSFTKWMAKWAMAIIASLVNAIVGVFNFLKDMFWAIVDFFKELPGKMWEWGAHMIQAFVDGAKDMWNKTKDFFGDIGNNVADFLGFSQPPTKGALKDIDNWGVHAMQRLANSYQKGMRLHLNPTILSALPVESFTPSASGLLPIGGGSSSTTSITVNVDRPTVRNDSDIDDIAERVSKKIYSDLQWNSRGVNS